MNLRSLQDEVSQQLMETRIVRSLYAGTMTRQQYLAYMQDVLCYAKHSSPVIGLAATRLVHSHPALASYLFHHATEELGHDEWAANDLRDLGMDNTAIADLGPSPACARMIGLEYYYAAHANPVGLFGWMFVLETLGGRAGGDITRALDRVLDLKGKALYFLRGHAEADADHCEDLFRVISANVSAPEDWRAFQFMVQESRALYCEILDHAADVPGTERARREPAFAA